MISKGLSRFDWMCERMLKVIKIIIYMTEEVSKIYKESGQHTLPMSSKVENGFS